MKKILFLAACFILTSCAAVNLDNKTKTLNLGVSKKKAINTLGRNYHVESKAQTTEGEIEVLHFYSPDSNDYILYFLDGSLVEFHKYIPPVYQEIHTLNDPCL